MKRRAKDKRAANKSLDVRAKQRLCLGVAWFLSGCVVAVSPHVTSTVRLFLIINESRASDTQNSQKQMQRDSIPVPVKRAVLVESGHRCAIPTCRATTTEIAHIVPWAESQDNSFENLIALCPNCHTRFDQKKEIDRPAIKMYKHNLGLCCKN